MATKVNEITVIGPGKAVVFLSRTPVTGETATFTTPPGPPAPCAPPPPPDSVNIFVEPVGPSYYRRYVVILEWAVNGTAPRTIKYQFDY